MGYSYKPKSVPCPNKHDKTPAGKHRWVWWKNTVAGSMSVGPNGSSARLSLKGIYRCSCGAQKTGIHQRKGDDLRQLLEKSA